MYLKTFASSKAEENTSWISIEINYAKVLIFIKPWMLRTREIFSP